MFFIPILHAINGKNALVIGWNFQIVIHKGHHLVIHFLRYFTSVSHIPNQIQYFEKNESQYIFQRRYHI